MQIRHRSHLAQNLDKFVLITKKSVKLLSPVEHAKCNPLVSRRTKTCPWRQIFKGAVVLPPSTTFCEQQTKIVFLVINLPVNSVNSVNLSIISFFHFRLHISLRPWYHSREVMNPGFRNSFPGFWDIHCDQMMNTNEAQDCYRLGQLFLSARICMRGERRMTL